MAHLWELDKKINLAIEKLEEAEAEAVRQKALVEELKKTAWFCWKCQKYYPTDICGHEKKREVTTETVYTDAGWGDDDEIAEVTRLVPYISCPVCGFTTQSGKGIFLFASNTRRRRS